MESQEISKRISEEISKLLQLTEKYTSEEMSLHEIEKGLLSQLLALGLALLSHIISMKQKQLLGYRPKSESGDYLVCKGQKKRQYLSLFGLLKFSRAVWWSKSGGNYYELDTRLFLPLGNHWSYNLQELIGEASSELDYRESVRMVNQLLGLNLSAKGSQRNSRYLGELVSDFYEAHPAAVTKELVHFSASFDGKGVPKIKPKVSGTDNPKKRLGKGEKRGVKQMATVSVTSCFVARKRDKDQIIRGLMETPLSKGKDEAVKAKSKNPPAKQTENGWHEEIHRRAFLADQPRAVDYGIQEIKRRMKNPQSRFVVPIDAGIGLEDLVIKSVEKHGLETQFDGIILDIIHVSEYIWSAATAIFGEKSPKRSTWVRDRLAELLDSKTQEVIELLIDKRDHHRLSKAKKAQIEKTITYFTNHKHKMDYKTFLEKGYPVSSALVESSCGHLVKDRMEQSGMRWSSTGAQNILDLRAVKINEDFEQFMKFAIQQQYPQYLPRAA